MGNNKGASSATVGYRYYMTLQMGLCRGPVDEIVRIEVGGLNAWPNAAGTQPYYCISEGPNGTGVVQNADGTYATASGALINTARTNGDYSIDASEIFGGDKKEGGISGPLSVYFGARTQTYSAAFKSLVGGLLPDFRGVVSFVFDGLVTSLNPYPKPWKVRVRRVTSGWDGAVWQPALAVIWMRGNTIKAMNPAHIIYECITNREWGRGFDRSRIDETSFLATAQTLFNENFGLSLRWNRQGELSAFVGEVLDHIGGRLLVDRETGKFSLGLLRADYDPQTVPLFTYNSGLLQIEESDTASQSDIVSEVIVDFRDPISNTDRQGRVQNLAVKQSNEGNNSTKRTYYGLPTAELALRVAQRDLKVNASALKRYKVILDHRAWRIQPGSVFRVRATDLGISNVVLRAGKVSEEKGSKIIVDAVIDVFGLPASSFASAPQELWQQPSRTPVANEREIVREATYHDLVRRLSQADLNVVSATSGTVLTAASRPTVMSQGYSIATKTTSETAFVVRNAGNFVPSALLDEALGTHETVVDIASGVNLREIEVGGQVQIGTEICQVTNVTLTGDETTATITLVRGTVDTIPQTHSVSTPVFFVSDDGATDLREYTQGEVVETKLLPFTSLATLPETSAATQTLSITARQNRPWPAGNVRINGTRFGQTGVISDNMVLTWAHRNRLTIKDQFVAHGDSSVPVEAGVEYEIRVFNGTAAPTPVRTVTVNADTWTYTTTMMTADSMGTTVVFEIRSVRAGLFSQFNYRFAVSR